MKNQFPDIYAKLVDENGILQPSARYFPTPWRRFLMSSGIGKALHIFRGIDDMGWDHAAIREVDWVPGCYLLTRKKIIDEMKTRIEKMELIYNSNIEVINELKFKLAETQNKLIDAEDRLKQNSFELNDLRASIPYKVLLKPLDKIYRFVNPRKKKNKILKPN